MAAWPWPLVPPWSVPVWLSVPLWQRVGPAQARQPVAAVLPQLVEAAVLLPLVEAGLRPRLVVAVVLVPSQVAASREALGVLLLLLVNLDPPEHLERPAIAGPQEQVEMMLAGCPVVRARLARRLSQGLMVHPLPRVGTLLAGPHAVELACRPGCNHLAARSPRVEKNLMERMWWAHERERRPRKIWELA